MLLVATGFQCEHAKGRRTVAEGSGQSLSSGAILWDSAPALDNFMVPPLVDVRRSA